MKALFVLPLMFAATTALAQIAFSVNGQSVPEIKVKTLAGMLQKSQPSASKGTDYEAAARAILLRQALVSQEAEKEKLNRSVEIQLQIEEKRTQLLLAELLAKKVLNEKPKESELLKLYRDIQNRYNPNELKVRQIVVASEQEASDLISKIKGGEDMAALAKKHSLEESTKEAGGEFPYLNANSIVIPGFAQAALALEEGQLMAVPFKSNAGYHVVRLEGKRVVPLPDYNEMKTRLSDHLMQQKVASYIDGLVAKAEVKNPDQEAPKPEKQKPVAARKRK
ncbi:peptidylprolyl isomerase [uncultured Parasutterella sp.]|uniref:peptidylprolyl isomerase n=2 Tax=uncultured Parasutterella sp. TaxID=1263098 RepID=UPI0025924B92|nr:peptidylprolyl isomerase [uncultured Parasutterella sp.]